MPSKPYTRSSCDGLTVIEMLVGLAITMAVLVAGLSLALSSLSLYEADHARVRLNQNLRATQEFLTADIRQAGERLGDDFPAIEILDGASGAPDEIVLRRNLAATVLRSCRDVSGTETKIYVTEPDPLLPQPQGCQPVPDSDGDGWPDNHGAWNAYRLLHGVDVGGDLVVPAYMYNPLTGEGEFFDYAVDDLAGSYLETLSGQNWQYAYPKQWARVYLLEERRYRVANGMLQVVIDGDDPNPFNLVERIEDLQATAALQDGTQQATFDFSDVWSELSAIEITVRGKVSYDDGDMETVWLSEIMPRNVLSH